MKIFNSLLILIGISLFPLIFTATIPYSLPTSLSLNVLKSSEHSSELEIKLYMITLIEGSQYTIDVGIDIFWNMDVSLRIAETPYMINGFLVNSIGYTGETMHFNAYKSGIYYIQVKVLSGSGFYNIIVESGTTNPATGQIFEFFDPSYLLILILPCLVLLIIGLIIVKRIHDLSKKRDFSIVNDRTEENEKESFIKEEQLIICPYCGHEFEKYLKRCPECSTAFE